MLELQRSMVVLINAAIVLFLALLLVAFILGTWGKFLLLGAGIIAGVIGLLFVICVATDPKGFRRAWKEADETERRNKAARQAALEQARTEWSRRP